MGLKICSLSSSSSGNCIYVASDTTKILIDSGIPLKRVGNSLRVLSSSCDGLSVLVTHTHSDHISGIPKICAEYGAKVYAHRLSSDLRYKREFWETDFNEFGDADFTIGDILVSPFSVSHDVPTVGYVLSCGNKSVSILTDLGVLSGDNLNKIKNSDLVFVESNHDEQILMNNPNYAYYLKRRILSDKGHLSNSACAEVVAHLAKSGIRQFVLGHLSKENNYPELAFKTVERRLFADGIKEGTDVRIEVAPYDRMSGLFEIC